MDDLRWEKILKPLGIKVKSLTGLTDWSESQVVRVDGSTDGIPSVYYLKHCRQGADAEAAVYRFSALHEGFPAPSASFLEIRGEEWLLLRDADGVLLADFVEADAPAAYLAGARRLARFHMKAASSGWIEGFPDLKVISERLETLPGLVLGQTKLLAEQGVYSFDDYTLLRQVTALSELGWPSFFGDFLGYPASVIHGDCHYGNLFLTSRGGISLIDWGSAAVAPGLLDIAALADVSLRMKAPSAPENELLSAYLGELPQQERKAYGDPQRAWTVCRAVRAFLELEWFASTGDDYGSRARRELILLNSFLAED